MPNPERLQVTEAVERAEERVQPGLENVAAKQKEQIAKTEQGINARIESFKRMGVYKSVAEDFAFHSDELRIPEDQRTPDKVMTFIANQFDIIRAEEGFRLEGVVSETITKLDGISSQLGESAAVGMKQERKAQEEYEKMIPEYDINPSNIGESLRSIGESIGEKPNVDKLVGAESEFDIIMAEIRKPQNASKYISAQLGFQNISGGKQLERIKNEIAASLVKIAKLAETNPAAARKGLILKFGAAMDTLSIATDIIAMSLFSGEAEISVSEVEDAPPQPMNEDDMQYVLNVLLHGAKDNNFYNQLFDAEASYEMVTGKTFDEMNTAEKFLVTGIGRGVGNMAAGYANLVLNSQETLEGISHVAMTIIKPETRAQLAKVLKYGWDTATPMEKTLLVTQLAVEISSDALLLKGAGSAAKLAKLQAMKGFGKIAPQMTKAARAAGDVLAVSKLAMAASPVLKKFPSLAKFGPITQLASTMGRNAIVLIKRFELVEIGFKAGVNYSMKAQDKLGKAGRATAAVEEKSMPIFSEMSAAQQEFYLAITNAKELGLSESQVTQLRSSLSTLQAAAA